MQRQLCFLELQIKKLRLIICQLRICHSLLRLFILQCYFISYNFFSISNYCDFIDYKCDLISPSVYSVTKCEFIFHNCNFVSRKGDFIFQSVTTWCDFISHNCEFVFDYWNFCSCNVTISHNVTLSLTIVASCHNCTFISHNATSFLYYFKLSHNNVITFHIKQAFITFSNCAPEKKRKENFKVHYFMSAQILHTPVLDVCSTSLSFQSQSKYLS